MSNAQQALRVTGFAVESRLPELEARLGQVNKQARKLGVPEIVYTLTGKVEDRVVKVTHDLLGRRIERRARFVEITIDGAIPVLPGGWTLVAVVDHSEGEPIVKTVPGFELPKGQRERGAICDHCGHDRIRKDTFVLVSEAGIVKQVGRNCLCDFLGVSNYSPTTLLALVTFLRSPFQGFDTDSEWDSYDGGFSRGRITIDVLDVVMTSGACIDEYGWVSRKRSAATDGREPATASDVSFVLFPPLKPSRADVARLERIRGRFTDDLRTEAEAAIAWAAAYEGQDDYPLNLRVCARRGVVGFDKLGIVVSLMAGYRREQEKLRERERQAKSSGFVGEVKKRATFVLTLVKHTAHETSFGVSHRCEFTEQATGFPVVWWASNDPTYGEEGWRVGEVRTVKATPKKHETYKGVMSTVVTRVAETDKKAAEARRAAREAEARKVADERRAALEAKQELCRATREAVVEFALSNVLHGSLEKAPLWLTDLRTRDLMDFDPESPADVIKPILEAMKAEVAK